jgi:hypothetical protein
MEKVLFFAFAALAGYLGWCPRGGRPPCPDPIAKTLFGGLISGALAGIAYLFLFLKDGIVECCDLIAVAVLAYLFALFIHTLFFAKAKE